MNIKEIKDRGATLIVSTLITMAMLAAGSGCSIKRMAANKLGDALAGSGVTFAADDDPELIKAAAPFSLKLMESILAETPRHRGLLRAAAGGFTQYAYAFVQQEADEMEEKDIVAATEMRKRARKLYLRARDYALRELEIAHPGFRAKLNSEPRVAVGVLNRKDVAAAYWAAASWGAATGIIKNDTGLFADLEKVDALADRLLALDPDYDFGSIHSFMITYQMTRPKAQVEPAVLAREHFTAAVRQSHGQQVSPYVSLAESVSVPEQNGKEFRELLNSALKVDLEARPEWRLSNLVFQRRARWLLSREKDFIGVSEAQ